MEDPVIVYTSTACPYCRRAKELLDRKRVPYREINVEHDPDREAEMIRITGRRTVPQILIHGRPVGGCDDLYAMERRGELDAALGRS